MNPLQQSDILNLVFDYIGPIEVAAVSQVCKLWNFVAQSICVGRYSVLHEAGNHVWNTSGDKIAVYKFTEVSIYSRADKQFQLQMRFCAADEIVCMDWGNKSLIATLKNNTLQQWRNTDFKSSYLTGYYLRGNLSQLKWNTPKENKLGVCSSLGVYVLLWHEDDQRWSHRLIKSKSTAVAIAWHPNGVWLAIGCANGSCSVVLTTYYRDSGNAAPFGEVLFSMRINSWILDLDFCAEDQQLVVSGRDSTLHFIALSKVRSNSTCLTVKHYFLPFVHCMFIQGTNSTVICTDGDGRVCTFGNREHGTWKFLRKIPIRTGDGFRCMKRVPNTPFLSIGDQNYVSLWDIEALIN